MSSGMTSAKETAGSKGMKDYKKKQKASCEGSSRARCESTPIPAVNDRNVKRKHCAIDFDTLDCPICLEPLSPPLSQCQNGHTVCAACCARLEKASCPSCSLPIGTNRCIALEKIIESMQVSCKYGEWGCEEMLQYSSERRGHEVWCEFRPYQCPAIGCHYKGLRPGLLEHFRLVHNVQDVSQMFLDTTRKEIVPFSTRHGSYDTSRSQYEMLQVFIEDSDHVNDGEGRLFLLHHQYNEQFCRYSFSCTSFGDCFWFTRYHISVISETAGGLKDKHSVEGPVHDNQTDPAVLSKIVEQGECLLVPKVHPAQKDGHEFELEICFLDDHVEYSSDEYG